MFSIEQTVLVVIDVQGRLAYLVHEKEKLFKHIQALIQTARLLDIPVIYTEQVPDKIGATVPEIKDFLKDQLPVTKWAFSCCAEETFMRNLKSLKRKEIVVCGIETHVCVYQTVCDLIDLRYPVQVVADAVSSRDPENKAIALRRMEEGQAKLTSTESIVCELLRTSAHPRFKDILRLIK